MCSALRISYGSPLTAPRLPRPPVDYLNGDLGWDPLGLKPTDPAARKEMETKELNHGRLAMIGIVGMVAQELVSGEKLF